MSDRESFEGFKQKLIEDNEKRYGEEARRRYGDEAVNRSNERLKNMTPEEYEEVNRLANEVAATLAEAFRTGDPAGDIAQRAADLHRQWLTSFWGEYSKEAHMRLAQMYVEDERFKAYYDQRQPGAAEFLRDAIRIYTGIRK